MNRESTCSDFHIHRPENHAAPPHVTCNHSHLKAAIAGFLLFALVTTLPAVSIVSVEPDAGWTSVEVAEEAASQLKAAGCELIDVSRSDDSGVVAKLLLYPKLTVPINHHSAAGVIDGYKESVEESGGQIGTIQRTKVGAFPAYEITGKIGEVSLVSYAFFTSEQIIMLMFQRDGGLAPEDVAITAYLGRIRYAAELVPGKIDAIDRDSRDYKIGSWMGTLAIPILLIGLPIMLFAPGWLWRKLKAKKARPLDEVLPPDAQNLREE